MSKPKKTQLRVLRNSGLTHEALQIEIMHTLFRVFGRFSDITSGIVKQHGLTLPHFEVLMCLHSEAGMSQQELSERLLFTKGNICIIVQKMEAAKLIDRRTNPEDQRFHQLYLTDHGRSLVAAIKPSHREILNQIMLCLSPEEQNTLHDLIYRLDQSLDEIEI